MNASDSSAEKTSTAKVRKHAACGYSLFTHRSFDTKKNKLDYYRGEDCMKTFSKDLRKHVTEILNYKKKKMIPLTNEDNKSYFKQNVCHICQKYSVLMTMMMAMMIIMIIMMIMTRMMMVNGNEKYYKVRDYCHYAGKYRGADHSICNLRYKAPKAISMVFHNGSFDYHFIIKKLAEEFKGQHKCLGRNNEKYITFSVLIKKRS